MLKMIAIYIFNTIKTPFKWVFPFKTTLYTGQWSDEADTQRELVLFVCPLPFLIVTQK